MVKFHDELWYAIFVWLKLWEGIIDGHIFLFVCYVLFIALKLLNEL